MPNAVLPEFRAAFHHFVVQVLHDDDLGLRSLSSFSSIGAMDEPKAALREAVELPMRYPELFRGSSLLQPVKVRGAATGMLCLGNKAIWAQPIGKLEHAKLRRLWPLCRNLAPGWPLGTRVRHNLAGCQKQTGGSKGQEQQGRFDVDLVGCRVCYCSVLLAPAKAL